MKKSVAVTAFLAALSATPFAHAGNTASMVLDWSNFSISFLKGSGSFATNSSSNYTFAQAYDYPTEVQNTSATAASAVLPGTAASGQVSASALTASASTDYGTNTDWQYARAYSQAIAAGSATLDKGAIIEFSVPYTVSVSVPVDATKGESSSASGGIFVNFSDGTISRNWQDSLEVFAVPGSPSTSSSGVFDVIIKNTTNGAQTLSWSAYSQAVAETHLAAPVPEPESYAMLIAGLGIIGAIVRRRKQQA